MPDGAAGRARPTAPVGTPAARRAPPPRGRRDRAVRAGLIALLSPLLLAAACGGGPAAGRPRALVLIVIDTLRADRLGGYGYAAAHTPNLDALAARGLRFADAMTPVPVTLPAVASLLTGRLPHRHGVRDNDRYALAEAELTLAERFRGAGWRTAAVLGSAVLAADRGLAQGFETYDDDFRGPFPVHDPALAFFADEFATTQRRADAVTDRALALAAGFADAPFFLFVHYFDVHAYYDPPPAWSARHPGRPYDGEISFVDAEIGRLLAGLERRDDALVVVVSDHGEGLGEHGEPEHGFLLHQSTLHVPILIAGPGIPRGAVRSDPATLVDLEPTLAAWCGLPSAGGAPRDGRALRADRPEPAGRTLYAETMRTLVSYGWSELRGLRRDGLKLVAGPREELYDLAADPREVAPRSDDPRADALRAELAATTGGETRGAVLAALGDDPDPERRELLESLGYIGDAGAAAGDPRANRPHPADALGPWLARQHAKSLYRAALTLLDQRRFAEGVALLDSVLAGDPGSVGARYNRALGRRELGDAAGYREDLDAAIDLDARYLPALTAKARDAEAAGRHEEAMRGWRGIVALDETWAPALTALAEHHLRRDEPAAALPWLRRLVNGEPRGMDARFNLGLAALRAGRADEARTHLEVFLELAPGDPRAAEVRRLLGLPASR